MKEVNINESYPHTVKLLFKNWQGYCKIAIYNFSVKDTSNAKYFVLKNMYNLFFVGMNFSV